MEACRIPFAVIADLDYVNQIGTAELKGFFSDNAGSIKKDVIDNPARMDGQALVVRMDEAIQGGRLVYWRNLHPTCMCS
jgi:hypothetical protein